MQSRLVTGKSKNTETHYTDKLKEICSNYKKNKKFHRLLFGNKHKAIAKQILDYYQKKSNTSQPVLELTSKLMLIALFEELIHQKSGYFLSLLQQGFNYYFIQQEFEHYFEKARNFSVEAKKCISILRQNFSNPKSPLNFNDTPLKMEIIQVAYSVPDKNTLDTVLSEINFKEFCSFAKDGKTFDNFLKKLIKAAIKIDNFDFLKKMAFSLGNLCYKYEYTPDFHVYYNSEKWLSIILSIGLEELANYYSSTLGIKKIFTIASASGINRLLLERLIPKLPMLSHYDALFEELSDKQYDQYDIEPHLRSLHACLAEYAVRKNNLELIYDLYIRKISNPIQKNSIKHWVEQALSFAEKYNHIVITEFLLPQYMKYLDPAETQQGFTNRLIINSAIISGNLSVLKSQDLPIYNDFVSRAIACSQPAVLQWLLDHLPMTQLTLSAAAIEILKMDPNKNTEEMAICIINHDLFDPNYKIPGFLVSSFIELAIHHSNFSFIKLLLKHPKIDLKYLKDPLKKAMNSGEFGIIHCLLSHEPFFSIHSLQEWLHFINCKNLSLSPIKFQPVKEIIIGRFILHKFNTFSQLDVLIPEIFLLICKKMYQHLHTICLMESDLKGFLIKSNFDKAKISLKNQGFFKSKTLNEWSNWAKAEDVDSEAFKKIITLQYSWNQSKLFFANYLELGLWRELTKQIIFNLYNLANLEYYGKASIFEVEKINLR